MPETDSPASSSLYPTYARAPMRFERGEGPWLMTENGDRFMDFAGGIAVNILGYSHPHLVEALKSQAEKLWHLSNIYQIPDQERLAERLCSATFADRVFFANSGAEALEAAIKTARHYHHANGAPERFRLITFEGAFHGRTLATIAAGGQAKYLEGFGPKVDGFDQVPFGDHEALHAALGPHTAGILVEPIQGEGGIRKVPSQCLKGLRELCDEHGILLIFDEIQSGMGRTGRLFAHEWAGIAPDIMAIAKGLGGGFPVGACLATEQAGESMIPGTHGSTFGGNPLAMAVGNAVLDVVLENGFLDRVTEMSGLFAQSLASIAERYPDVVAGLRGEGLMLGLQCTVANTDLVAAARDAGLLTVAAGDNVVRLLPPLNLTDTEAREGLGRLEQAVASLAGAGTKAAVNA